MYEVNPQQGSTYPLFLSSWYNHCMSDYYYFKNKKDDSDFSPILGDDYISALLSIAKKHGINITDEIILKEVEGKQYSPKKSIKKPRTLNIRSK